MEGIKGSASLIHSDIRPQPSQDPPAVHQDDDQGEAGGEGEGSVFLQGNNMSAEARNTGSSLAATSTSQRSTLGGNSSISEALPKTSNRETLISSKHSQSLGTASKLHSGTCQDKLTLQRKTQPVWRSLPHHLLQKVRKSSSGSGRDPFPQQPSQGSLARGNKLPTGRTRQEKGKNWTRCRLDWPVIP